MSNPYVGEIRMFAGNFAPAGWAFCDGQTLPIAENTALFNLVGTTYGGNGTSTFALPDLRSRVPMHQGSSGAGSHVVGEQGGVENVTLTLQQMAAHTHAMSATTNAAGAVQGRGSMLASNAAVQFYGSGAPSTAMAAGAVSSVGGGQSHTNMAPFQAVNFIISLYGVYPTQS